MLQNLDQCIETEYKGCRCFSFSVEDHAAVLIVPENYRTDLPFVWRTEFLGAFDAADRAMLEKGYILVYYKISNLYGSPAAVGRMKRFYDTVTQKFALNAKTILFGFSRGGLYAVNFAAAFPKLIAALYLDAPVLDIRTWPCGVAGYERERKECLAEYGIENERSVLPHMLALEKAELLAVQSIPVVIVAGRKDSVVPIEKNSDPFVRRFRAAGGNILYIEKKDCDHHPHSLEEPGPIVEFLQKFAIGR